MRTFQSKEKSSESNNSRPSIQRKRTYAPGQPVPASPDFSHDFSRVPVSEGVAQREGTEAASLPSAEELTSRIARCIGIWETNRGKDNPAPRESDLDTFAGMSASMATIEQATMPYAITALKKHKSLREKADPPLTLKELNAAEARCVAVTKLLPLVDAAAGKGTTPEDFISANQDAITATGLSDSDVQTMFDAVTLKGTIEQARTDIKTAGEKAAEEEPNKAKKKAAKSKAEGEQRQASIDAISEEDRLGLDESSLKAYINKPHNWGEHRAGWQRKAVEAMPDNVASRIETVAEADNGTGLASAVVGARVATELAKEPKPTEEALVKAVGAQNNPGEPGYGDNIWKTYSRLYPQPAAK